MTGAEALPTATREYLQRADRGLRRARRGVRIAILQLAAWLRRNSEHYLLEAAQTDLARQAGRPPPAGASGVAALLWRRGFVPLYHRLPWRLRRVVMTWLPGSHRRTWHAPPARRHPAV